MKTTLLLIFLTTSTISFGQINTWEKNKGARSGAMIQYNFQGDLNQIIKTIRKDLGREQILHENMNGRRVKFHFKKIEWSDERLELLLWAITNDNKHIVTIACYDKKDNDYLTNGTVSRALIEEYFDKVFKKKAFSPL